MPAPIVVVWFRRDLRLADHPALHAAVERGAAVVPLFVVDPRLATGRGAPREAWLHATLGALAAELRAAGAPLVVRRGDPRQEVPRAAREAGAAAVHWSDDFTPYARRRDAAVAAACAAIGVEACGFAGSALVAPGRLATSSGGFYTVFTPFHRAWSAVPAVAPLPAPGRLTPGPHLGGEAAPVERPGAGHAAARAALGRFVRGPLAGYERDRDRVDRAGTSRLSAHLRLGRSRRARHATRCSARPSGTDACAGPPTRSCASSRGATSSRTSCGTRPRAAGERSARIGGQSPGATIRRPWWRGRKGAPAIRWWTRECGSSPPRASCTIAPASSRPPS
jgi:deoxyribodipyrimidine photo-lyase